MSFSEIMELKDEILKNNRELELRLKNQIENYSTQFSDKLSTFQKKINTMNENNNKVMNSIPDINFNISKINQLEKFDLRVDNRLSSHDLRITTILTEIEKIKTKYDKIVLDNLYVPGHVGGRCQFPNLSEYLTFNINEVSLLKLETEQLKKDSKNMKNKHDNTIKQIVNLIDGSVKRCNEYTDNKQKDFQFLLDTRMKEFNEKVMEIRMNVCKIQMKTEEEYNNLSIEFSKLFEEKKEFTNFFQNKLMTINEELSSLQKDYKANITDIKQKNKNIGKDVQNIKDNINELIKLIKFYQKTKTKNIHKNYNAFNLNMSSDDESKINKINKRATLMPELENSNNKMININNSVGVKNNNLLKNRRNSVSKNITNSTNVNTNSKFVRNIKKRNTMFYTGPILELQNNNINNTNNKKKINDELQVESPTFYGLLDPILHKIVDGPKKEEVENNKSISSCNSKSDDKFSVIYSDRNTPKKSDKSNNFDNKKNQRKKTTIIRSDLSSKVDLEEDSDSDSISNEKSQTINENDKKKDIFNFSKRKKKSNSKQYFSKLTLKPNIEKESKKSIQSNSTLLKVKYSKTFNNHFKINFQHKKKKVKPIINNNEKNFSKENNNNYNRPKKGSLGSIESVKSKYNNWDIADILGKKLYLDVKKSNIKGSKNIKSSINNAYEIIKNANNINDKMQYSYNEDEKNNNNNYKIDSKNERTNNKNAEKSQNNLDTIKNKNNNIIKNNSPKLLSRNNNNQNNSNYLNAIISNSKLNNLTAQKTNNPIYTNNYSNTINIYSSLYKNHKLTNVLTPHKEKINKILNIKNVDKKNNIQNLKNVEVDSDTGIGYNVVSFEIPENISLPPKKIQYYPLLGKKIHKKQPIKTETFSPLDEIYRQQYNKKLKLESLSSSNLINEIPKKISPAFGRTAYAFYSKKEIEEFGGNITNSINLKGNANPINIKYLSKGKPKFINEISEDI